MTRSEKLVWQQMRAQGRGRFVWREGVLRRGLPFGVSMTLLCVLIDLVSQSPIEPLWKLAVKCGFYVLVFGLLSGSTSWRDRERDFHGETENDDVV